MNKIRSSVHRELTFIARLKTKHFLKIRLTRIPPARLKFIIPFPKRIPTERRLNNYLKRNEESKN